MTIDVIMGIHVSPTCMWKGEIQREYCKFKKKTMLKGDLTHTVGMLPENGIVPLD